MSGSNTNARIQVQIDAVDNTRGVISNIASGLKGLNLPSDMTKDVSKNLTDLDSALAKYTSTMQSMKGGKITDSGLSKMAKEADAVTKATSKLQSSLSKLSIGTARKNVSGVFSNMQKEAQKAGQVIKNSLNDPNMLGKKSAFSNQYNKFFDGIKNLDTGNFEKAKAQLSSLRQEYEKLSAQLMKSASSKSAFGTKDPTKNANLQKSLDQLKIIDAELSKVESKMKTYESSARAGDFGKSFGTATTEVQKFNTALNGTQNTVKGTVNAMNDIGKSAQSMTRITSEANSMIQSFFSVYTVLSGLRQGIGAAVSAVKELDAAMAEQAVVTDFSISDLWGQLPQYTKAANELGVAISDVYNATTLYAQQGLDVDRSMALGVETMKMARIAGMEAAAATDSMTAALRGFNMEISEKSAKKINDVYSQIAAKTATDVKELSTATEKDASLAYGSGVSFEANTAFLAQMLETTREAPENLGTAMKTILARFQNIKEDPTKIFSDESGDYSLNSVDKALQSIGVSLTDTNGELRDAEDVIFDISGKWDTLTKNQKKYVATQAAGSRQQSRFIALVGNEERLQEIYNDALNASGASDEQFEKTLDSLESKSTRLKNTFDQLAMSFADSGMIKGAVDGLNFLLSGITKVDSTFDKMGKGIGTSFSKMALGATGLTVALKLGFTAVEGGLKQLVANYIRTIQTPFSSGFGQKIGDSLSKSIMGQQGAVGEAAATLFEGSRSVGVDDLIKLQGAEGSKFQGDFSKLMTGINGKFYKEQFAKAGQSYQSVMQQVMSEQATKELQLDQGAISQQYFDVLDQAAKDIAKGEKSTGEISQQVIDDISKISTSADFKNSTEDVTKELVKGINEGWDDKQVRDHVKKYVEKFENVDGELTRIGKEDGKILGENIINGQMQTFDQKKAAVQEKIAQAYTSAGVDEDLAKQRAAEIMQQIGEASDDVDFGAAEEKIAGRFMKASMVAGGLALGIGALSNAFRDGETLAENYGKALNNITAAGQGVSQALGIVSGALGTAAMVGGPAGWIIAGIGAIAAAVAGIQGYSQAMEESRKATVDHGKEVMNNFKEQRKELEANAEYARETQPEFERLAKGVDDRGKNVSLTDEDYKKYKEYAAAYAEMNSEVITGIDSQGNAIVKRTAAQDVLNKSISEGQKLTEEMTSQDSIEEQFKAYSAALDEKEFSDKFKKVKEQFGDFQRLAGQSEKAVPNPYLNSDPTAIANNANDTNLNAQRQIAARTQADNEKIRKGVGEIGQAYKDLGIEVKDVNNMTQEELRTIVDNEDAVRQKLLDNHPKAGENAAAVKQFDTFASNYRGLYKTMDEAREGVKEQGKAIIEEQLDTVARYKDIDYGTAVAGLGGVIDQSKLDGSDFQDNLTKYLNGLSKVEAKVGKSKRTFGESREAIEKWQKQYEKDTGDPKALDRLQRKLQAEKDAWNQRAAKYEEEGQYGMAAAVQAFADSIDTAATSVVNMTKAFNPLQAEMNKTKTYADELKEVSENDYYSGLDRTKETWDTINTEKNKAGRGSRTYWKGAEQIIGTEAISQLGYDQDKVQQHIENYEPILKSGAEGAKAFADALVEKKDDLVRNTDDQFKLDTDENGHLKSIEGVSENLEQIADVFGLSVPTISSAFMNLTQFGSFDWTNSGLLKDALKNEGYGISNEKGEAIVGAKDLKTLAGENGVETTGKAYDKFLQNQEKSGLRTIDSDSSKELLSFFRDDAVGFSAKFKGESSKLDANEVMKSLVSFGTDNDTGLKTLQGLAGSGDLGSRYQGEEGEALLKKDWQIAQEGGDLEAKSQETSMAAIENNTGETAANTAVLAGMNLGQAFQGQVSSEAKAQFNKNQTEYNGLMHDEKNRPISDANGNIRTSTQQQWANEAYQAQKSGNWDQYHKTSNQYQALAQKYGEQQKYYQTAAQGAKSQITADPTNAEKWKQAVEKYTAEAEKAGAAQSRVTAALKQREKIEKATTKSGKKFKVEQDKNTKGKKENTASTKQDSTSSKKSASASQKKANVVGKTKDFLTQPVANPNKGQKVDTSGINKTINAATKAAKSKPIKLNFDTKAASKTFGKVTKSFSKQKPVITPVVKDAAIKKAEQSVAKPISKPKKITFKGDTKTAESAVNKVDKKKVKDKKFSLKAAIGQAMSGVHSVISAVNSVPSSRETTITVTHRNITENITRNSTENLNCFVAGTLVHTSAGLKKIEDVQIGDNVLSFNEYLQKNEYSKVRETMIHQTDENMYIITIENDTLVSTGIHPFYVANREDHWVKVEDLCIEDKVMFADGTLHKISNIEIEYQSVTVYNFEVSGNHNYFVGESGILVHNKLAKGNAKPHNKRTSVIPGFSDGTVDEDEFDTIDSLASGNIDDKELKKAEKEAKKQEKEDKKNIESLLEGNAEDYEDDLDSLADGGKGSAKLTLTGEIGPELAWMPSEGTARMLGQGGPELTYLPKDAVVFNNLQTKKIAKRGRIPGSEIASLSSGGTLDDLYSSSSSSSTKKSSSKATTPKSPSSGNGNSGNGNDKPKEKPHAKTRWKKGKMGKVEEKVYNLEAKIANLKVKQNKLQEEYNRRENELYTTMNWQKKNLQDQIKLQKQELAHEKSLLKYYNAKLKALDKNKKVTVETGTKQQKWDSKKKKWKNTGKVKKKKVNLGKYIKKGKDGTYVIDWQKLNKTKYDKKTKQNVVEKIKEYLDKWQTNGKFATLDNIQSTLSAIDELQDKIEGLKWDLPFTKIWNLNQALASINEQLTIMDKKLELAKKGFSMAGTLAKGGNTRTIFDQAVKARFQEMEKNRQLANNLQKDIQKKQTQVVHETKKKTLKSTYGKKQAAAISAKNTAKKKNASKDNKAYDKSLAKAKKGISAKNKKKLNKSQKKALNSGKKIKLTNKQKKNKSLSKQVNKYNKVVDPSMNISKKNKKKLNKNQKKALQQGKTIKLTSKQKKDKKLTKQVNKYNKGIKQKNADKAATKASKDAKKKAAAAKSAKKKADTNFKKQKSAIQKNTKLTKKLTKEDQKRLKQGKKLNDLDKVKGKLTKKERAALKKYNDLYNQTQKTYTQQTKWKLSDFFTYNKETDRYEAKMGKNGKTKLEEAVAHGDITSAQGEKIEDAVSKINEEAEQREQAIADIEEAFAEVVSLYEEAMQADVEGAEDIRSAIEEAREKTINKLQGINDAINNANTRIVERMQKQIDEQRQVRQNEKTEKDLREMNEKLAYLRQDTSGKNAVEIKQLEEQLKEQTQSYEDTLVDQQMQKFQQNLDEASAQRERQIKLLESISESTLTKMDDAKLIQSILDATEGKKNLDTETMNALERIFQDTGIKIEISGEATAKNILAGDTTGLTDIEQFNNEYEAEQKVNAIQEETQEAEKDVLDSKSTADAAIAVSEAQGNNTAVTSTIPVMLKQLANKGTIEGVTKSQFLEALKKDKKASLNALLADTTLTRNAIKNSSYLSGATLKDLGATAKQLKDKMGYSAKTLNTLKYTADQVANAGYTVKQMKDGGFTLKQILGTKKYSWADVFSSGAFSEAELKKAKDTNTLTGLRGAYSGATLLKKLKTFGYDVSTVAKARGQLINDGTKTATTIIKDIIGSGLFNSTQVLKSKLFSPTDLAKSGKYNGWKLLKTYSDKLSNKTFLKAVADLLQNDVDTMKPADIKKLSQYKSATAYKEGGLANYTGPAWLDGTKAKPEAVLNAKQTAAFIQLSDVLSDITQKAATTNNVTESSTNNYEININVDEIANDYDVDKLQRRIEQNLLQKAGYRNINRVSNMH